MTTTPRLGLAYLVASQAQKEITHNEALNDLDGLVHLSVATRTLNTPPASPLDGDVYLVGSNPNGAWSTHADKIACYFSGWIFKTPRIGWIAHVNDEARFVVYTGTSWTTLVAPYAEGHLTWIPGTLSSGAGLTSSEIAVSGAALGDFVQVAAPYDLLGAVASAYVKSVGSVVVRLQNGTGIEQTFGSGEWSVRVHKA